MAIVAAIDTAPLLATVSSIFVDFSRFRYEEEPCAREQALAAPQASLLLVNLLRDAGARFELGLGGVKVPAGDQHAR